MKKQMDLKDMFGYSTFCQKKVNFNPNIFQSQKIILFQLFNQSLFA